MACYKKELTFPAQNLKRKENNNNDNIKCDFVKNKVSVIKKMVFL